MFSFRKEQTFFTIRLNLTDLFLSIFILEYLLSTLLSIEPVTSLLGTYGWNHGGLFFAHVLILIFYFAQKYLTQKNWIIFFLLISVLGFLASFLLSIFNLHFSINSLSTTRIAGTEFHPIYYGMYIMIGLIAAIGLLILVNNHFKRMILILISCFGFLLLISNGTRSVWIAFVLSLISISLILLWINQTWRNAAIKNFKELFFIFFIIIGIIGGIFFIWQQPFGRLKTAFGNPQKDPSTAIRLLEWKGATEVIKNNNFLLGTGPATVKYTYPLYKNVELNELKGGDEQMIAVRNIFLDYAANLGFLPAITIMIFFVLIFYGTIRLLYSQYFPEDKNIILVLFWLWLALLIVFIFYHYTITSAIYFWAVSGILAGLIKKAVILQSKELKIQAPRIIIISGLFLGIIISGIAIFLIIQAFIAEIILGNGLKQNNPFRIMEAATQSYLLTPYDARKLSLVGIWEFEAVRKDPSDSKFLTYSLKSIEDLKKARQLTPNDSSLSNDLSTLYFKIYVRTGDKSYLRQGKQYIEDAVAKYPTSPFFLDNLAQYYLAEGDLDTAEKYFRKEIDLKTNYTPAYYHLGEVYKQRGEYKIAKDWYQKSLQYWDNQIFVQQKIKEIEELEQ